MNIHLTTFLSHLPSDSLVSLHWAMLQLRNGDVHYPFRQDSDFLYLTGLSVPGLVLTVDCSGSGIQEPGLLHTPRVLPIPLSGKGASSQWQKQEVILWREPITENDLIWGSDKLTDRELADISGIEDIRDIEGLDLYTGNQTGQNPPSPLRHNSLLEVQTRNLSQGGMEQSSHITTDTEVRDIIHSLRLIKTPDEISKIRKAIAVSQEAFAHIESMMRPWVYEYEIEAEIARIFRSYHLIEAYPSIVASGPNACILHYSVHTRQLAEGDFVLIDAGAEYMGYASDMTRTLSVWSVQSARKKAVYAVVERIKIVAEKTLKPGISLTAYETIVRMAMNEELTNLWLIPQNASKDEVTLLSKKYYPHRTSHFLGLDVHDVGPRDAILVPGMVLTIEPGIYIREEGIGIRIEDDYRIIEDWCERLS